MHRDTRLARLAPADAAALHHALGKDKLKNPPTDGIRPLGEGLLIDSLAREYPSAFIRAGTGSPPVTVESRGSFGARRTKRRNRVNIATRSKAARLSAKASYRRKDPLPADPPLIGSQILPGLFQMLPV